MWEYLPDLLLETVYSMLSMRQRYYTSMVCRNWNRVFYSPHIWRSMEIHELSFTYRRSNLYTGYQEDIMRQHRVQMYLATVGCHVRHITILPSSNFFNLRKFLNILCSFLEFFDDYSMPQLHDLYFAFSCETRSHSGPIILGTGGEILEVIRRLLGNVRNLDTLTVNNLLLENLEAPGLLQDVMKHCRESLKYLEILNCTKNRCPLFQVGMFPNLKRLVISPLQLTNDVVLSLAQNTALQDLVIVQDKYNLIQAEPVNSHVWWEVKQVAPKLKVRLEVRGPTEAEMVLQENAPVLSIVYQTPYALVSPGSALQVADLYRSTLEVYAYTGLPKRHGTRSFHDRCDSCLVLLVRECRRLRTLIIRQRLSTSTLLILASEAKQLQELYVRRNAVLLRCDWPRSPEWTAEYFHWLKTTAASYDKTEVEVGRLLNCPWQMLSDSQFKSITV